VTYVDAPAEWRDTSAINGVLVYRDDLIVHQNTKHILADSGKLIVKDIARGCIFKTDGGLTLVPMSKGALTSAHAVKWVFASSYVRSPFPTSSCHVDNISSDDRTFTVPSTISRSLRP